MAWKLHALERTRLPRRRRVDSVGCPTFDFHAGAWRVTWKNGDTEPDRLPAACLARAPPAEKPRDGALHRWVEVYWAGDAKWYLGRVVGKREGELKIADTSA